MKPLFIALLLCGFNTINAKSDSKGVFPLTPVKKHYTSKKATHCNSELAIVMPVDKATIRNNSGNIAVEVKVIPDLYPGDKLYMLLDGAVHGDSQSDFSFQLMGIDRGTHTIAIQIVDSSGAIIKTSSSIEIYLFRPRINMKFRH